MIKKLAILFWLTGWVLCSINYTADATDLIKVFFNQPELSTSTSKIANPDIGIDDALVKFIETAKSGDKVYLCFQTSTTQKITDAIIAAKDIVGQGNIFHIMERAYGTGYGFLNNSIDDGTNGSPLMHNKFAVIINTNTNPETGRIWTGSYNPTWPEGTKKNNNNAIRIESYELAKIYADEFMHMYNVGFSTNKTLLSNTAKSVFVGNTKVEVYFSPYEFGGFKEPNTVFVLEDLIDEATHSILFNMFTFGSADDRIKNALIKAHKRGVEVKGVVEADQTGSRIVQSELKSEGIDVVLDANRDKLHHKFCIIDYGTTYPKIITGSHNWTKEASNENDENFLVIHSREVAELYWQEFQKNYALAGGATGDVDQPAVSEVLAYPSPARFVNEVTIGYTLSSSVIDVAIKLYTLSGERVIELIPDFYPGTYNEEKWSLTNKGGDKVASGLYIIKVEATTGDGTFFDTEKFAVIR